MGTGTTATGAEQAAAALAGRLRAVGWQVIVNTSRTPSGRYNPGRKYVFVHANGSEVTGYARLVACWSTVAPLAEQNEHDKAVGNRETGSTAFHGAEFDIGDVSRRELTEAQMSCWLDAILAVGAAVKS